MGGFIATIPQTAGDLFGGVPRMPVITPSPELRRRPVYRPPVLRTNPPRMSILPGPIPPVLTKAPRPRQRTGSRTRSRTGTGTSVPVCGFPMGGWLMNNLR